MVRATEEATREEAYFWSTTHRETDPAVDSGGKSGRERERESERKGGNERQREKEEDRLSEEKKRGERIGKKTQQLEK